VDAFVSADAVAVPGVHGNHIEGTEASVTLQGGVSVRATGVRTCNGRRHPGACASPHSQTHSLQ